VQKIDPATRLSPSNSSADILFLGATSSNEHDLNEWKKELSASGMDWEERQISLEIQLLTAQERGGVAAAATAAPEPALEQAPASAAEFIRTVQPHKTYCPE